MKNSESRICPFCSREYKEYPAISRKDNVTEICPDCGTREALGLMGVNEDEIEHILETIHYCKP